MAELRLERYPAVVEQDLPEIYAFIARDDPPAAERVIDAVEAAFSQLTRHPESGRRLSHAQSQVKTHAHAAPRWLPKLPHLLRYRIGEHSDPLRDSWRVPSVPHFPTRATRLRHPPNPCSFNVGCR